MYNADPNDNTKQIPKNLPDDVFSKVTIPAENTLNDRPAYVIINEVTSGAGYAFAYTSASFAESNTTGYISGSIAAGEGPIRIDIQPVAWRQTNSAGTVGDISFVYKGGL